MPVMTSALPSPFRSPAPTFTPPAKVRVYAKKLVSFARFRPLKTWTDGLGSDRAAMMKVLADLDAAEDVADVKEAAWRTAAKLGQEQLRLFKRDLENAGLSRVQIFDIIPDASPTPRTPKRPATPPANTDTTSQAW